MVKWELDFWYELWDRAGSQGLDTWYDPLGGGGEGTHSPPADEGRAAEGEPEGT